MQSNQTYRRKRASLARQLKHLRELSGLSGNQFAKSLGWAQSKVSRIETGAQLPTEDDLLVWTRALKSPKGEYGSLLQLLEQAEAEYNSWRANYKRAGSTKNKQVEIKCLEANSKCIREFQLCLVPGLLQTAEYAKAVLSARFGPLNFGSDDHDVRETVAVRMERQKILYDTSKTLSFVVPEACLFTRIASKEVQLNQLQRLIDITNSMSQVDIGIIPFNQTIPLIPLNGFAIYDDTLVLIESLSGEQQLSSEEDTDLYLKAFDACLNVSLRGKAAAARIRMALDGPASS